METRKNIPSADAVSTGSSLNGIRGLRDVVGMTRVDFQERFGNLLGEFDLDAFDGDKPDLD